MRPERLLLCALMFASAPVYSAPARFDREEQASINVYKAASPAVVTVFSGQGTGAGSVVSSEGLVLTNEHVIRGSRNGQVTVQTTQGKRYGGQVIAVDRKNDLALVRLSTRDRLPTVPLAGADGIQVGQRVYAIGSPFGLSGTLTTGILSRVARDGDLQTDAALNPGNSGGPLLNSQGELIGVNKEILSPGGQGNIGIGFATSALAVRDFIARNRRADRNGELLASNDRSSNDRSNGDRGLPPRQTQPAAPQLGVTVDGSTLVIQAVKPGSLADELGLQPGDRLLGINGRRISGPEDLRAFLETRPISAVFTVARNQRLADIEVDF
ncbi:S1C family serine protease [Anthocerotibacter panamensis]|uniref:S1C family serine protease n=1 Tax=Anthocerotibacter panamensis TaxID=2857077 RepID=UPI001C4027F9|nr:trypsin-like peptidase domain-containing protein [Anthocerotibacter panamensis]